MVSDFTAEVLVVSQTDKAFEFLKSILPSGQFSLRSSVHSGGEAQRSLINKPVDIVVINAPLKDGYGTDLAITLAENYNVGVLIMVKADMYEQIEYKVEDYGILTISRPCTSQQIFQAMKLLSATRKRIQAMERKTMKLEQKMKEVRVINQAKGLLMEHQHMTEAEAHRHLEKAAMDNRTSKMEMAERIIQKYN